MSECLSRRAMLEPLGPSADGRAVYMLVSLRVQHAGREIWLPAHQECRLPAAFAAHYVAAGYAQPVTELGAVDVDAPGAMGVEFVRERHCVIDDDATRVFRRGERAVLPYAVGAALIATGAAIRWDVDRQQPGFGQVADAHTGGSSQ